MLDRKETCILSSLLSSPVKLRCDALFGELPTSPNSAILPNSVVDVIENKVTAEEVPTQSEPQVNASISEEVKELVYTEEVERLDVKEETVVSSCDEARPLSSANNAKQQVEVVRQNSTSVRSFTPPTLD